MNRRASPETIAAIRAIRAEMSADKTYAVLGTTPYTYIRVVDGLPVQDSALRRIEAKLAERAGEPPPPPPPPPPPRESKRQLSTTSKHVKLEGGRVLYEAFGRWQTAPEWCAEMGVPIGTFRARVAAHGRTPEQALTMPRVRRGTFVLGRRAS